MNNNVEKEVLLIGATPESAGLGGVTVHVERLIQFLEKEHFAFDLYDYKTQSLKLGIKKIRKAAVIHLHVCNPYFLFLLIVICRFFRKKTIITLHGKYVKGEQKPWLLIKFAIHKCFVPIVLNSDSFTTCKTINRNTVLIPAFIPPQKKEGLDKSVIEIVDTIHNKGHLAVVTYGYDELFDAKGKEIYGIFFLLSYFKNNPKYTLIVVNPTGNYKTKYSRLYPNVVFIDKPLPLYELLRISDIFIRNTSKDGDSLSVKESLYLRKRVICTDVVERPDGTLLFSYSDAPSLQKCLDYDIINTNDAVKSGELEILHLYKKILGYL